jgi:hypothetical protein
MVKVTFTLDDETVRRLRETAERLQKPQSLVVREAVADYAVRAGELTEVERRRLLRVFDDVVAGIPKRPAAEVAAEIRAVRRARRAGRRQRA